MGGGRSKKVEKGRVRVKYCGALELKVEKGRIRSACSHKMKERTHLTARCGVRSLAPMVVVAPAAAAGDVDNREDLWRGLGWGRVKKGQKRAVH